jgi:hypothetical protein
MFSGMRSIRDLPDSPPPDFARVARHGRGAEVWAAARDLYLDGASAPEVCERFGIGLSTFRDRAAREGWRRADVADALPPPAPAWSEAAEAALETDPEVVADRAWRSAARAVAQGRVHEARRWTRLARDMDAMSRERARHEAWQGDQMARAVEVLVDIARDAEDRAAGVVPSIELAIRRLTAHLTAAAGRPMPAEPDDSDDSDGPDPSLLPGRERVAAEQADEGSPDPGRADAPDDSDDSDAAAALQGGWYSPFDRSRRAPPEPSG